MSQYQVSPWERHLEQVLHIFSFLKNKPKLILYMDLLLTRMYYSLFKTDPEELKKYYWYVEEEMPHRIPRPRDMAVVTTLFVGSSHGLNKLTGRSHSGHIFFKPSTCQMVESSTANRRDNCIIVRVYQNEPLHWGYWVPHIQITNVRRAFIWKEAIDLHLVRQRKRFEELIQCGFWSQ